MKQIKWIITAKTLIVYCQGKTITLNKTDKRYRKVMRYISKGNEEKAIDFLFPAQKIVKYANGAFTISGKNIFIKGRKEPVHPLITSKLLSFYKKELPVEPLIKFSNNLDNNPSDWSKQQLFEFLTVNQHPITTDGQFLAYKYVSIKKGDNLVDSYTGKFNNNIGQTVTMKRSDVDDDPNSTCSHGLHVASYDYARSGSSTMIEVLVHPRDVVAVPTDCDGQKMRVCKYKVIGFGKTEYKGDFIDQKLVNKKFKTGVKKNKGFSFANMTSQQIVNMVKKLTGYEITFNLRSKQSIVRKAEEMFIKSGLMKKDQALDIHNMTAKNIVKFVKSVTGKTITASLKSKQTIIKKAEEFLTSKK